VGEYLQKTGNEFGSTTGRPRRCGWFDVPAIKYAHMICNFSSMNITKLDVLDQLAEIKIGIKYLINGKPIEYIPSTLEELSKV